MNSRPMSNIDKQALRTAAENATPGEWCTDDYHGVIADAGLNANYYIASCSGPDNRHNKRFIAAANPATVLALLDELEAKDKRLNEILKPNMLLPVIDNMDEDNLRHVIKTVCENYSLLHAKWEAAEKRAELEAKKVTIKLPESFYPDGDIDCPLVINEYQIIEAIVAAGCKPIAVCPRCNCELDLTHKPDGAHYCHPAAAGKGEAS